MVNRTIMTIATTCAGAYLIKSLYGKDMRRNRLFSGRKMKRFRKRIAKVIS
ncbi:hypothetical protein [Pseudalkalibacillus salsuginis]|uniref:hypothetical protein n=1 Tax=Pseudalkalibacillus salsuginis TaxID=2910972 RepID=UPI001F26F776|nr:hypothetical protein [Pseudalkalibacillus salsuginis]MCF6408613.1 hypothetical protein [Pseudalkalibacillus salsuginis]